MLLIQSAPSHSIARSVRSKASARSLTLASPSASLDVRAGGRRLLCMVMETPGGPMQM